MSYHTWHTYGYGIRTSDITGVTVEKLKNLIHLAPEYEKAIQSWLKDNDITEPTLDDLYEYDYYDSYGLAGIIKEVIYECEKIDFTACDDFDGLQYLLIEPIYPWQNQEYELLLSPQKIEEIIKKYIAYITDKDINVDYYEAANGG